MEGWKKVKLSDVCEIYDCPHSTPKWTESGKVVIRNFNIKNGRLLLGNLSFTDEKTFAVRNRRASPDTGDLILTREAPMGEICIIPSGFECCLGQRVVLLKPSKQHLEGRFLLYLFLSEVIQHQINIHNGAGSVVSNLRIPYIADLQIPFPPLPLQRSIAEILGALDDKIEINRQMNQTLEEMAQALYKHYFVDDIDPENLPEGWRNGILGEVVNIRGGGTPSTTEPKFWNGSIFWTSPKDLSNQKSPFLIGTEKKITELGLKKVSSGLLPEETILMSSRAPIGYIAISDVPVAINQGYIAILPDSKFSTHFMYFWLKNNLDLIIQYANGSTFLEISKNAFREIEVIIPPDNLIEKFIQSVRPNFDFIKNSTYETTQLKKIRDYLLPKLISGDIIPSDIQTIEKAL